MDWLNDSQIIEEFKLLQKNMDIEHKIMWRSAQEEFGRRIKPLLYLDYHFEEEINVNCKLPIDKVFMYNSVYCASIPRNMIFATIPNIQLQTSLTKDLQTIQYMFFTPIHTGKSQEDALESFYKNQAQNYDAYRMRFLHGKQELMKIFPLIKNKTVLDIGGATGFNFEYIKKYVDIYKNVTVLDLCSSLLNEADKRIKQNKWKKCKTMHQDVMTFNSSVKYDIIMISYTLTMVPDWKLIVDKIYSLLPKNGYLMITDFTVNENNSSEGLLWRNIFNNDKVYLNSEHVPYIRKQFKELFYKEDFGGFPYFPDFVKCRYYYGVYIKK